METNEGAHDVYFFLHYVGRNETPKHAGNKMFCVCVSPIFFPSPLCHSGWMVYIFVGQSSQVRQRGRQYGERKWIEYRENITDFISHTFVVKWFGERPDLNSSYSPYPTQSPSDKTYLVSDAGISVGFLVFNPLKYFIYIPNTYLWMVITMHIHQTWLHTSHVLRNSNVCKRKRRRFLASKR